jgi:predicted RND superfamily exporter protein
MDAAVSKMVRPILVAGLTTIFGFASLLAATDFLILRDFSILTLVAIFLALVSTFGILPTLAVGIDSWRSGRSPAAADASLVDKGPPRATAP